MLPGTGGLTRVVDKRKVRRDLADVFGTVAEGVKGKRAVEWRLVDAVYPTSQFKERVAQRAAGARGARPIGPPTGPGITLSPLNPTVTDTMRCSYSSVSLEIDRDKRVATLTVTRPGGRAAVDAGRDPAAPAISSGRCARSASSTTRCCGCASTSRTSARSSSRREGDPARVLAVDETLLAHQEHWLVREIVHFMKRTLKRMDLTSRSFFALIEPGSCFAGTLFELALAADRSYMLDDPDRPNTIALSAMNGGPLTMSNGLTRLETRFLGDAGARRASCSTKREPFDPQAALEAGLVSFAPDELDWDDEVRLAVESRAAFSPDALTGHGSQPALRRAGDDGDEDLRPAHGVAELDLPAAERRRREGRADGLRLAGAAGVRLQENVAAAGRSSGVR